jgi:hypothetical protein
MASDPKAKPPKEPQPGHGPREQKALPIVEVVHELDEPDQACRSCGGALQPIAGQFQEADGLDVDSSTLWEQTWHLSRHLLPTYEANHVRVLDADAIAVDETWWRLMRKGASKRSPTTPRPAKMIDWIAQLYAVEVEAKRASPEERLATLAALLYSLIESAKLCGVEPRAYLGEAARRAIRDPGTVTLPRDLK